MITSIVQFPLPKKITLEEAGKIYSGTAPKYQTIKGLIRKYYLLSENGEIGGGVYLWESKDDADNFYSDDWNNFIFEKYGVFPTITFFESPVIVDNNLQEIIGDL